MSTHSLELMKTIHAIHHLIEKCLLFYMDRNECVACLQKHANLKPDIITIVWDELERSNAEFFTAYAARRLEHLESQGAHSHKRSRPSFQLTASVDTSMGHVGHSKANENQHVPGQYV